jgi:adenylate cyclase class 2
MSLETEVKLKVDDHASLRDRLTAAGAHRLGSVLEHNHIYDRPDRSLFAADEGLRVRVWLERDGRPGTAGTLTFKGPRRPGRIKSRPELEVEVADARSAGAILEAIGFVRVVSFQKRRETWELSTCRVELDELPPSNRYVEIEGPDEATIRETEIRLGLDPAATEDRTYIALVIEHLGARLPDDRDLLFEN